MKKERCFGLVGCEPGYLFEQFARQGDGWGGVEHQGNAFAAAYLGEMNDGFYRDFELGEDHSCFANRCDVGVDVGGGD